MYKMYLCKLDADAGKKCISLFSRQKNSYNLAFII